MSRILYAEDDEDLSDLTVQWLTQCSHMVDKVESGLAALEFLELNEYDLILLDCNLLHMNGLEVCKLYRSRKGLTPIILMTGSQDKDILKKGVLAGANTVLVKPPDLDALELFIQKLASRR